MGIQYFFYPLGPNPPFSWTYPTSQHHVTWPWFSQREAAMVRAGENTEYRGSGKDRLTAGCEGRK